MIQKVKVEEFLSLADEFPVLDVRSPGEFAHAHIPGAYNVPLFSDEERKIVGTAYKQQSREQAIKTGLDFFGGKMRKMVEEVEEINSGFQTTSSKEQKKDSNKRLQTAPANCVLIHCWRGGMRSAGVAWLLDLYGFKVYTLVGGYKAFRNYMLQQFEKPYRLQVIGGFTGAGKTRVLSELSAAGHLVIDLEAIAHHKGSAFGYMGQLPQPAPEMFENILALKLLQVSGQAESKGLPIWIEDESRRIGDINLPRTFWETIRKAPLYFLDVPFEERLKYLVAEYGKFKKEELISNILRIRKRLGGLATKNAVNYLLEDNTAECFRILLHYYDKYYNHGLNDRDLAANQVINIHCAAVDAVANMRRLINEQLTANGLTNTTN